MKRCAKCDFEYDDAYDGCPVCSRAATMAAQQVVALQGPSADDYGSGNLLGALLSVFALLVSGAFMGGFLAGVTGTAGGGTGLWGGLLSAAIWGLAVGVDASSLKRPVPDGYRIKGTAGTSPGLWGLFAFMLGIVGVPMYFYQRPRIKRAYEIGTQMLAAQASPLA